MTLQQINQVSFDDQSLLEEYKIRLLAPHFIFLINANHYIVGSVGSGKTTLMAKLIVLYQRYIHPYILYFSNFGPDETKANNLNNKGIKLITITYAEAQSFLLQFDEIKYKDKEIYTYWKLKERDIKYDSDYITRMKESIVDNNKQQRDETDKQYRHRLSDLFQSECIKIINEYGQPSTLMRFDLPSIIKGVQYSKKLKIIEQDGDQEFIKIPILTTSSLLSTLMIFDDIGSNTDIQRYTSKLARSITHLVSDSRHSKNTIFFCAQRPQYLFKSARVLCHVIAVGANIAEQDQKQIYEQNNVSGLNEQEFIIIYNSLQKYEFIIINKSLNNFDVLKRQN